LIGLNRIIDRLHAEKRELFQWMTGLLGTEISDERALSQSISELVKREDKLQHDVYDLQGERTRALTLFSAPTFDYLVQSMKSTTDENANLRNKLSDLKDKLRRAQRQFRAAVALCQRRSRPPANGHQECARARSAASAGDGSASGAEPGSPFGIEV
jgi:hypothetical protein